MKAIFRAQRRHVELIGERRGERCSHGKCWARARFLCVRDYERRFRGTVRSFQARYPRCGKHVYEWGAPIPEYVGG